MLTFKISFDLFFYLLYLYIIRLLNFPLYTYLAVSPYLRVAYYTLHLGLVDCDRSDCDRCGGDGSADCNLYVDDSTGDTTGDSNGDSTGVSRMTGSIGGDVLFIVSCWPTFLSNSRYLVKA